jgi:hypothetical protein
MARTHRFWHREIDFDAALPGGQLSSKEYLCAQAAERRTQNPANLAAAWPRRAFPCHPVEDAEGDFLSVLAPFAGDVTSADGSAQDHACRQARGADPPGRRGTAGDRRRANPSWPIPPAIPSPAAQRSAHDFNLPARAIPRILFADDENPGAIHSDRRVHSRIERSSNSVVSRGASCCTQCPTPGTTKASSPAWSRNFPGPVSPAWSRNFPGPVEQELSRPVEQELSRPVVSGLVRVGAGTFPARGVRVGAGTFPARGVRVGAGTFPAVEQELSRPVPGRVVRVGAGTFPAVVRVGAGTFPARGSGIRG